MQKPKIIRLALVVLVITAILSCIPLAAGYGRKGKINIRPIEDWLMANNLVDDQPMGYMLDWDRNIFIQPHLIDPSYAPWGYYKPPMDCVYDGFVLERKLSDNKILVSVNLRVKEAPFYILFEEGGIVASTPIFSGVMDYIYLLRFTIDLDELGPDDFDENGNVKYMPWWWYVWVTFTLESLLICGSGSGVFVNPYKSWEAGDTAKMFTLHLMVVVEDYTGPLLYNPYGLNGVILADSIILH